MQKPSENIFQKFIVPPAASLSVKALLILFYISVFTVGIELSMDIAKGEFQFFKGVLTKSQTVDPFSYLDLLTVDRPVMGTIPHLHYNPPVSDVAELLRSRSPPQDPII